MGDATRILVLPLTSEIDVVAARQRAREIAELLRFDKQDQIRIATAVSEIARNAQRYGRNGRIEFGVTDASPQSLLITVKDQGPGIPHLDAVINGRWVSSTGMGIGISAARRLVDRFSIESSPAGTIVTMERIAPPSFERLDPRKIGELSDRFISGAYPDALSEVQRQNQELILALEELQQERYETDRLNEELAETNRGVLALYAELDEKAESLRKASEEKTRFLSNMSHEFRTPLNSIISLSQMLQSELDGTLSEEQRKQATFIRGAAQSLSEMVNDLLDIAKIEAGKVALRVGEFELRDVVTALRGMFRPQLSNAAVSLELHPPPEGTILVSDEGKLTQILRNLVSNALKYTQRGSVRVTFEVSEERAVISVSDTGIGIPRDYLEAIFQEFVQVDNTLQRRVKGTGLGLSLSRRLAHLLGGEIEVTSELGAGSTFTLDIPRYLEPNPESEAESATVGGRAAAGARHRSSTALLVDDEESARYVLRSLLPEKIAVMEASSGAEALEKLRSASPDFVVLDVAMPGMDGFELARRLRASARTASIPLVFYTSLELADGQREEASRLGIPVISKTQPSREAASACLKAALSELGLALPGAE